MPDISNRGRNLPASPIRKLVPYANAAKERGIKVYHLNIGQPDIETPERALNAVRNLSDNVIAYSPSQGIDSLREEFARYYQNVGIDIGKDKIYVTTGGSEALLFSMLTITNPGDEVIIPEPFYTNYNGFAKAASVTVNPVKSSIDNDFALPPIREFEDAITSRTKAILICNPNNPTGYLYSKEELEELSDLVKRYNLFLITDEVYREFAYDGREHHSVLNFPGLESHAIMVDSVSKRYSECGIRIGTLVSRNTEVMEGALKLAQSRLSPPYFGQVAAEASISVDQEYFDTVFSEYDQRRKFLINALNDIDGVRSPMPKGAFYSVVELPVDDSERFCQWLLEEFNYKNQTVMLAPASGFYATPGRGKHEVRIAYVLKQENLENAVEVLKKALEAYPGTISVASSESDARSASL